MANSKQASREPTPDRTGRRASRSVTPVRGNSHTPSRQASPATGRARPRERSNSRGRSGSTSRRTRRAEIDLDGVYDRITSATNRLTDCSIEPFDGSPGKDIEEWLQRYADLAVARRWDDIAMKEQLATFFTDKASKWLKIRKKKLLPNPQPGLAHPNQLEWNQLTRNTTFLYRPDQLFNC